MHREQIEELAGLFRNFRLRGLFLTETSAVVLVDEFLMFRLKLGHLIVTSRRLLGMSVESAEHGRAARGKVIHQGQHGVGPGDGMPKEDLPIF